VELVAGVLGQQHDADLVHVRGSDRSSASSFAGVSTGTLST
jgi:hypothetical protein